MATQSSKYGTLNFEGNPVSVLSTGEEASYGISYQDSSGKQYYFVPDTLINTGTSGKENSYFFPFFLNKDNLSNFFNKAESVNLLDLPYGQAAANVANVNTTGYLVPASVGFDNTQAIAVPKSQGNITGIAQKDGKLVYATTGGAGNAYGWVESSGTGHMQPQAERKYGWLGDIAGGITDVLQSLGPITPIVLNAISPGAGTGYAIGTAIGSGGDVGDVLKSIAINQAIGAVTNAGETIPSTAGTDTAFLQDMDQGIFTDTTLDPAFVQDMSQGIEPLTPVVPETVDLNAATADLQNVYGGNLPIEDVTAAFDTVGPLADTTAATDTAFLQDTSQGIEPLNPVVPQENPFLAGMEQTTATEGAGVAGAENPTGTYEGGANYLSGMEETAATEGAGVAGADNPTGATTVLPTEAPSLTPQQAYQLLKLGAGLFGGAGALTMAAKGLAGGAGALGGLVGPSMPSIQAPTPFTGTYSGMNPYDAAYFQQVQQNYNRLFPTTPANVAGPLESWYQTKYVPDTTISNKLFGV